MQKRTATKSQIKKERNPHKVEKVIKQKECLSGKLPKGKVLHHRKAGKAMVPSVVPTNRIKKRKKYDK